MEIEPKKILAPNKRCIWFINELEQQKWILPDPHLLPPEIYVGIRPSGYENLFYCL